MVGSWCFKFKGRLRNAVVEYICPSPTVVVRRRFLEHDITERRDVSGKGVPGDESSRARMRDNREEEEVALEVND